MQMYPVYDLGKISESVREKSERYMQNGDDIDRTDRGSFYLPRKALKSFLVHVLSQIGVLLFVYRTQYAFWV